MIAYRFEMHTAEQVAGMDPFSGDGIQLSYAGGLAREEAESRIQDLFGVVPYVAFPSCAWLDARGLPESITPESAVSLWQGRTSCYSA